MNSFSKLRVPEGHKEKTGFCSVIKSMLKNFICNLGAKQNEKSQ
jgi:hypothetical protein